MKLILTILLGVAASGCITSDVWRTTINDQYVIVYRKDVSDSEYERFVERAKEKDGAVIITEQAGDILIKKSKLERVKDYTITTLGTPVMITVDATVFVVKAALQPPWVFLPKL